MAVLLFKCPERQRIFKCPYRQRVFKRPPVEGTGSSPVTEPVVDYRRTMIPWEIYAGHSPCFYLAPAGYVYYLLPDGTEQHNVLFPTYTAPSGEGNKIIWAICEDGHTVADITNIHYVGDRSAGRTPYGQVNTSDLMYMRPSAQIYLLGTYFTVYGDVANVKSMVSHVSNVLSFYSTYDMGGLYGDIGTWEPLKCLYFYGYYYKSVYGSLKFVDDAPTSRLWLTDSYSFSPEDISQTIVNWDECNPATFARIGRFSATKRSQLTAAGEAAVVSLIAKGCVFTFLAE